MTFDQQIAMINQQTAEHRHKWVVQDRSAYYVNVRFAPEFRSNADMVGECVRSFNEWSQERAEYARAAMKEMGITDKDQFYA